MSEPPRAPRQNRPSGLGAWSGSTRLGQTSFGFVWLWSSFAQAWSDLVRLWSGFGQAWSGLVRLCPGFGQALVRLGQAWSGFVKLGQAWSGLVGLVGRTTLTACSRSGKTRFRPKLHQHAKDLNWEWHREWNWEPVCEDKCKRRVKYQTKKPKITRIQPAHFLGHATRGTKA